MQSSNTFRAFSGASAVLVAALSLGCGESITPEEHFTRGESALARGEMRSAAIEFKNVLQAEPTNAKARALLGQAELGLGDVVAAEQDLERASRSGLDVALVQPWLARSWLKQGKFDQIADLRVGAGMSAELRAELLAIKAEALLAQGNPEGAATEAEAAMVADANSAPAMLAMARLKATQGGFDEAVGLVGQALERDAANVTAYMLLGDIERAAGHLDKAETAFTRAMQDESQRLRAQLSRAGVRIQDGRLDEAQADIDALKQRVKDNLLVDFTEAQLLYARREYAKAIQRLEIILGTSPNYIPAVRLTGATRFALGEPELARIHLQRVVTASPEDGEARRMLIMALLQVKEAGEAEQLARDWLETSPNDTAAQDLLASALMMQGKRDEGLSYLRRVSAEQPGSATASARLGSALLGQGDVEEGLNTLREALKQDPALQGAAEQLVSGYVSSGDLDKALQEALGYRDRNPKSVRANVLLGAVYLQREQFDEAEAAFRHSLELEPGNLSASLGLATLALRNKDFASARADFEQSLEHHPDDQRLPLILARLAMAQQDNAGAKGYLEAAAKRDPKALEPKLYLAAYYQQTGDPAHALELLGEAERDFPANPMVLALTADAQMALRQFDAAKSTLEDLLIAAPSNARVRFALALAYASLGDYDTAKVEVGKALALDADLAQAVTLQTRLAIAEKDVNEAEQGLQHLTRLLGSNNADVLLIEAQLARLKGDLSAANDIFQRLIGAGGETLDLDSDPSLRNAAEQMVLGYVQSGDPQGALKAALDLTQHQPESARAHNLLASLYARDQQLDLATQSFQRALQLEPGNMAATAGLAALAVKAEDLDRAQALYEEGLKGHPGNVSMLNGLARVALLRNDAKVAEDYLLESERANPLLLQPKLFRAAFYLRQSRYEDALGVLNEAGKASPNAVELLALRAEAELGLRQFDAARDTLARLNRAKPDQPKVLIALAKTNQALGRLDEAERSLRRVVDLDPKSVVALSSLVRLAIARDSFSEAESRIEALESVLGAEDASVLVLRGMVAEKQGDMASALKSYQRMFDVSPNTRTLLILSEALNRSNDMDGAVRVLVDWLEKHADDALAHFQLGQLYLKSQRLELAVKEYRATLEKQPDNVVVLNNLAWLLQDKEPAQALEYARQAHEKAPKSADITDTLAVLVARHGDVDEAKRLIDLALADKADNGSMLFHKAQILDQAGDPIKAQRVLESALKLGGNFAERTEAEAMLKRLTGG